MGVTLTVVVTKNLDAVLLQQALRVVRSACPVRKGPVGTDQATFRQDPLGVRELGVRHRDAAHRLPALAMPIDDLGDVAVRCEFTFAD
jgi:hypothetical protein